MRPVSTEDGAGLSRTRQDSRLMPLGLQPIDEFLAQKPRTTRDNDGHVSHLKTREANASLSQGLTYCSASC